MQAKSCVFQKHLLVSVFYALIMQMYRDKDSVLNTLVHSSMTECSCTVHVVYSLIALSPLIAITKKTDETLSIGLRRENVVGTLHICITA